MIRLVQAAELDTIWIALQVGIYFYLYVYSSI